jgi:hypothetical protein
MKPTKQSKQLPLRGTMLDLARKKDSTILDYAKATPIVPDEVQPTIIQNLRKQKGF